MGSLPEPTTAAGRAGLTTLLDQPEHALVALDFDGTLAPIVPDPEQARAHPDAAAALARLAGRVAVVAVVTGRPAAVAVRLGGFDRTPGLDSLTVLGAYGAERWDAATGQLSAPPPHPGIKAVRSELPDVIARFAPGAFLEDKGGALAVHTRRASDPVGALAALRDPLGAMAVHHGLALEPGRFVLELRPPGTDKGAALTDLARETNAGSVLYAGDDLGDLRAFEAVLALRHQGVPGLRVCSANTEAPELAAHADLLVPGPEGVVTLLRELSEAVRRRGQETP